MDINLTLSILLAIPLAIAANLFTPWVKKKLDARAEKKAVDNDMLLAADMLLSAYPCTADHSLDREFNDSITHRAVDIQKEVFSVLLQKFLFEEKTVYGQK